MRLLTIVLTGQPKILGATNTRTYIYIYIYIWPAALSYCLAGCSPRSVPMGYAEAYAVYIYIYMANHSWVYAEAYADKKK